MSLTTPELMAAKTAVNPKKHDPKSGISKMLEKNHAEQINSFEKIFLAQMTHQDPLNPMDNNEFASSIMMFHSTAQQSKMNEHLEQINLNHMKAQTAAAKSYLNKEVEYQGDEFTFEGDEEKFNFTMPDNVDQAQLAIIDAAGKGVTAFPLATEVGLKNFTWNGSLQDRPDIKMPSGQYHAKVIAQTKEGQAIEVPITFSGVVRKIGFHEEASEFALLVKNTPIEISDMTTVSKPASSALTSISQKYDALAAYLKEKLDTPVLASEVPELSATIDPGMGNGQETGMPISN